MAENGETGSEDAPLSDPRWEAAVFGREVEQFIEHDRIGQYLIQRARQDLESAQEQLLEVDPSDAKKIAALQLDARVANRVRGWLGEAIRDGQQAADQIEQERHASDG